MYIGWSMVFVFLLGLLLNGRRTSPSQTFAFEKTYQAAQYRAKRENRPLLLEFYAHWCSPCRELEKNVLSLSAVIQESAHFICYRVNSDVEATLVSKYKVMEIPTILITDSDGNEIQRIKGILAPKDLIEIFRVQEKVDLNFWSTLVNKLCPLCR